MKPNIRPWMAALLEHPKIKVRSQMFSENQSHRGKHFVSSIFIQYVKLLIAFGKLLFCSAYNVHMEYKCISYIGLDLILKIYFLMDMQIFLVQRSEVLRSSAFWPKACNLRMLASRNIMPGAELQLW